MTGHPSRHAHFCCWCGGVQQEQQRQQNLQPHAHLLASMLLLLLLQDQCKWIRRQLKVLLRLLLRRLSIPVRLQLLTMSSSGDDGLHQRSLLYRAFCVAAFIRIQLLFTLYIKHASVCFALRNIALSRLKAVKSWQASARNCLRRDSSMQIT